MMRVRPGNRSAIERLVQHSSQSRAGERDALLGYGERICAERD
jgi:hypothetical protein